MLQFGLGVGEEAEKTENERGRWFLSSNIETWVRV